MKRDKTILEAQSEIEAALQRLPKFAAQLPDDLKPLVRLAPPQGAHAQVSLRHARTARQVKRNAPADAWSPDSGAVSISYEARPAAQAHAPTTQARHPERLAAPQPLPHAEDPAHDFVLALAKAESDPQMGFISLKWFRDSYLPQQGYSWAASVESRQKVLVDVINRRWILTSKVPNPKHPQFPVTAIRVNRPLAEVRKILDQEAGFGSAFAPLPIAGEPLSETVVRERR